MVRRVIILVLACLLFLFSASFASTLPDNNTSKKSLSPDTREHKKEISQAQADIFYAIHLSSTINKVEIPSLPQHPALDPLQLYQTTAIIDGKKWYRWRLGFFQSKADAVELLSFIKRTFPAAWVVRVSANEWKKYGEPGAVSLHPDQLEKST